MASILGYRSRARPKQVKESCPPDRTTSAFLIMLCDVGDFVCLDAKAVAVAQAALHDGLKVAFVGCGVAGVHRLKVNVAGPVFWRSGHAPVGTKRTGRQAISAVDVVGIEHVLK